jgi:acyl-coenzyme A synthetase/AMP-(fatty) acid ligase/thioesterase domain-containing protein
LSKTIDTTPPPAGRLSESVVDFLCQRRERFASSTAVIDAEGAHTYEDILGKSERIARHLVATGWDSEFIVLFLDTGADASLGILASMLAGKCSVVVTDQRQLETMLARFPAAPVVLKTAGQPIPHGLAESGRHLVDLTTLPDLPSVDTELPRFPFPTTPAQVILTSGSTGEAKAVLHPHCAIQNQIRNFSRYTGITPADRIAVIAPLHTITGQSSLFSALLNGAAACFYSVETGGIDGFADWIQRHQITILHATPTIFRHLADLTRERDECFSSLRLVRIGGEPITASDLEAIRSMTSPDCAIYLGYGCSELGTITRLIVDHETSKSVDFTHGVPVGQPCENITVTICDGDGMPLPEGEVGEVVVSSDYLSLGYHDDPDANRSSYFRAFDGTRSYRTGDLGVMLNGNLFLRGRADRQVKIRGHRVELDAVEAQLSAIPGFGTVAVEAVESHSINDPAAVQLNAFLASEQPELLSARALRQVAAAVISPVIVPARFLILPELPQTRNGKIDREALRQLAKMRSPETATPPESELEAWLLGRWRALLHRDDMGTHEDFFELGGDSMTAVRIFHEIAGRTGTVLPVSILLEAPTVAEIARKIVDRKSVFWADSLIVTLRQGGSQPPLFLVHDIGGNVLNYRRLAQELSDDQPVYAIRSPALDSDPDSADTLPHSVEDLAAFYIQAVTDTCGERPIALAGLSFGGKVAFEMARQLHLANREIAFLGLLDTRLEMQDVRPGSDLRILKTSLRRLIYQLRRLLFHAQRMATGKTENDYLHERIRKRKKKQATVIGSPTNENPAFTSDDPRVRLSPEQLAAAWHRKLGEKWRPLSSPVPVHYFVATEPSLRGPFNNMANWQFLATGGLHVKKVRGNHISVLEDPNIATVAKVISSSMGLKKQESGSNTVPA